MSPILLLAAEGGFNPLDVSGGGGIFWTVVIFLVALLPIWKLVMGPVTRALDERDARQAAAVAAAEKAAQEAEAARAEVTAQLRAAQVEAGKIVEAARTRAEVVERELKDQAGKEAQALIARATAEIGAERQKALAAIRAQVVELSLHAASRVLARKVDAADDRRLVDELVAGAAGGRPAEKRS